MKKEPEFILQEGQVDFTNIRWCPVINCVLKYGDKILLLQRNENLRLYPGYWNGIAGFLDDNKSLVEKVEEELREEIGLDKSNIVSIKQGQVFDQDEPKYKKTWIVHPILVEVNTDKVRLDWEAQKYEWFEINNTKKLKLLPGFENVLKNLF